MELKPPQAMDFARPSNTGSLIGAVMVGLLALGANHYIRMDPQVLQNLFPRTPASDSSADESATKKPEKFSLRFWGALRGDDAPVPRPPEQVRQEILDRMKAVEMHLLEKNEKQQSGGGQLPADELGALLQLLDQLNARLEADLEASAEQHKEARLSRLYGHYLAAEIQPSSFSASFLKNAEEGIQCPDETEASHATALKLLHELDLTDPSKDELLAQLQDFTQQFPDSEVGFYVYSIVSRELWQRGHRQLSEDVLRSGAKSYAGQRGVSRLLNQLIDQRRAP